MTNMWCVIDSNTGKNLITYTKDEFDNEIKVHIIERMSKVNVNVQKNGGEWCYE